MSRDTRLFLMDIISRCERIEVAILGKSFSDFTSDDLLHEVVFRHKTIIGEAVNSLPEDIRSKETETSWMKIARLRDILIRVYFGVKDEMLWQILSVDIVPLQFACERLLQGESGLELGDQ